MPVGSTELDNSFGETGYGGPEPPAGSGQHQYKVILYALNTDTIDISGQPSFAEFEQAVKNITLAKATLTGVFGR